MWGSFPSFISSFLPFFVLSFSLSFLPFPFFLCLFVCSFVPSFSFFHSFARSNLARWKEAGGRDTEGTRRVVCLRSLPLSLSLRPFRFVSALPDTLLHFLSFFLSPFLPPSLRQFIHSFSFSCFLSFSFNRLVSHKFAHYSPYVSRPVCLSVSVLAFHSV